MVGSGINMLYFIGIFLYFICLVVWLAPGNVLVAGSGGVGGIRFVVFFCVFFELF